MTHIEFTGKREIIFGIGCRTRMAPELAVDCFEKTTYGIGPQGALPEHILMSGRHIQFNGGKSGSFLTSVMLLFHKEI